MELPTTASKDVVDDTLAVEDEKENSIAVVLDQEIDALQINYATVASDIEMDKARPGQRMTEMLFLHMCLQKKLFFMMLMHTKPLKTQVTQRYSYS